MRAPTTLRLAPVGASSARDAMTTIVYRIWGSVSPALQAPTKLRLTSVGARIAGDQGMRQSGIRLSSDSQVQKSYSGSSSSVPRRPGLRLRQTRVSCELHFRARSLAGALPRLAGAQAATDMAMPATTSARPGPANGFTMLTTPFQVRQGKPEKLFRHP